MATMPLRFIEGRRRRLLALRDLVQHLSICLEQSIHRLNKLASYPTDDAEFSRSLASAWINGTFALDQSLIEPGPFSVAIDQVRDNEKHHLLHGARASTRLPGGIQGGTGLSYSRRPSAIRFETACVGKILNRANGCQDRCRLDGTNPKRLHDLPFSRLLNNRGDLLL